MGRALHWVISVSLLGLVGLLTPRMATHDLPASVAGHDETFFAYIREDGTEIPIPSPDAPNPSGTTALAAPAVFQWEIAAMPVARDFARGP